jgi:hypothetical protein
LWKGELIATQFKQACPGYVPTQQNFESITQTLAFNTLSPSQQSGTIDEIVADLIDGGYWTVTNLKACFDALTREGVLDVPAGSTRNLSSSERLKVTRLAQGGQVDAAIGRYICAALDGEEPTMEMVSDPTYRPVCDAAVWAVFKDITNDFVPTAEREAYIKRHVAGRPVTIELLQSAWAACQRAEQSYARQEVLAQAQGPESRPVSARELEGLSDEEVDSLYHRSLRQYAQAVRPGVVA